MLTLGEQAASGDRHLTGVAAPESHRLGGCSMVSLALGLRSLGPNGPLSLGLRHGCGVPRWRGKTSFAGGGGGHCVRDGEMLSHRCRGADERGWLIQASETP